MSLKNKLKRTLATTACLTALLGPALSIQDKHDAKPAQAITQSATNERGALSFPDIQLKKNTVKASTYTVDNLEGRLMVLGFDLLFNGLKSGIGAKSNGDDFWPAFGKGALAGMIVYGGKEIASYNGYVPFAGAMGKIFHDLGVSMSDNIAFGRPVLSRYVTDFGPIGFDFEKGKGTNLFFYPVSAGAIIYSSAKGGRLDFKQTLYNLTPVFSLEEMPSATTSGPLCGRDMQNIIIYDENHNKNIIPGRYNPCRSLASTFSHEMNHVLVASEFRFLDELAGMKKIRFGPSLIQGALGYLPSLIFPSTYYYMPMEFEAYTMERPSELYP